MPISSRSANVLSVTLEGILYGFSVFMFILSMWFMLRDRGKRHVNYYMVAASCTLLVFSTVEMGVNIGRLYQGFISEGPFLPGGPEAYFTDVSQPTFIVKSCLYNVQTLILDAVVIYRVIVVWKTILIAILPIISWFGLLADCIGLNWALITASTFKGDVFAAPTGRWITSYYSLTLGTNLLATIFLASKIWMVNHQSTQYRSGNIFSPVLRVIIESGAIYSMTMIASLITFVRMSDGADVLLDPTSPIISIVFHMIIIRLRIAAELSAPGSVNTNPSTQWNAPPIVAAAPRANNMMRRTPNGTYEMRDLKIEITRVVENDAGDIEREHGTASSPPSPPPASLKRDSFGSEV